VEGLVRVTIVLRPRRYWSKRMLPRELDDASLASAPELPKNAAAMPVRFVSSAANSAAGSV
jgi:hypothetical protein